MHLAALVLSAFLVQAAPTVTTGSADSVTTGSAVVNGTVNPAGAPTTYHFDYGTTSSYGLRTPDGDAGSGSADVDVHATLTNLTENTTYHYRLVAGSEQGADKTFKTSTRASAPAISSRSATSISAVGAVLNAGVNPRGLATSVHFEYGTSTSYGASTAEQGIGSGSTTLSVTAGVAGLKPNTRYNFRAVATSAAGIARGANRTFTTGKAPTGVAVTPTTTRPVWGTGLTMNGTVSGAGSTPVALEKLDFPFTGPWTQIASTTANPSGAFTLAAPGLFITTRLRVITLTPVVAVSPVTTATVAVKVGLKTKRLSHRRVQIEGATWPAVPDGRASLQRQTRSGRWDPVSRMNPSSLPGGRSRYRFRLSRGSRALSYRVVVNPRDGGAHASGVSRLVTVPKR